MYRTLFVARHYMPDDRLAHAKVEEDGVILFSFKAGHIHPVLMQDLAAMSQDVADAGVLDLRLDDHLPAIETDFVRVEDWLTGGDACAMHTANHDGRLAFQILVNEHLIDYPTVREMNTEMFPVVCRVLVPVATGARRP